MVNVFKKVSENYELNSKIARNGNEKAKVFDVTIAGAMGFLDPQSIWGGIAIKGRKEKALSLMGMWEGLKVFKRKDEVDTRYFCNEKMVGKIRDCKSYGELVGMRWGNEILSVEEGMDLLFRNIYKEEILERFGNLIRKLRELKDETDIVLLDYRYEDRKIPISHAEILKELIES